MNKYGLLIVILLFALLTLNVGVAHEIDNSTKVKDTLSVSHSSALEISNDTQVLEVSKVSTHIDVASKTNFDAIGDSFKVEFPETMRKYINKRVLSATNWYYLRNTFMVCLFQLT